MRNLVYPNVWYTLGKIVKIKLDGIRGQIRVYQLTDTRESGHECHFDFRVALAIASADREEHSRWSRWPESRVVNYFGLACIG